MASVENLAEIELNSVLGIISPRNLKAQTIKPYAEAHVLGHPANKTPWDLRSDR